MNPHILPKGKFLYHFCPEWMLKSILREGLTKGKLLTGFSKNGPILKPHCQWLTINPEWNQSWCEYSSLPYKRNDVRLSIDIPEKDRGYGLRHWLSYCKEEGPNKTWDVLNAFGDPDNWYLFLGRISRCWITLVLYNPHLTYGALA